MFESFIVLLYYYALFYFMRLICFNVFYVCISFLIFSSIVQMLYGRWGDYLYLLFFFHFFTPFIFYLKILMFEILLIVFCFSTYALLPFTLQ